jgi:hypothetical protein
MSKTTEIPALRDAVAVQRAQELQEAYALKMAQDAFRDDPDGFISDSVVLAYQENHATEIALTKAIVALSAATIAAPDGGQSMHYAQAALNLAHVLSTLDNIGK